MPEFREFIEFSEEPPRSANLQPAEPTPPIWDGWGDENDRQAFYKTTGVEAPSLAEEAARVEAARVQIAQALQDMPWEYDDGWGEDPLER